VFRQNCCDNRTDGERAIVRFHVVGLPHTQTTKAYSWSAFTEKARKFATMMAERGHEVYLYASEENEARCTELVTCITRDEQDELVTPGSDTYDGDDPQWKLMNGRVIHELRARLRKMDFLCLTVGTPQKPIADAFPATSCVEYGVGYAGAFAKHLVFESYAWMHAFYGHTQGLYQADGRFFDAVIPHCFDVGDFPFSAEKDDYFLYLGRLHSRKGYQVAAEIGRAKGLRLKMAGSGEPPPEGVEYLGVVGPAERGKLLSRATALLAPTLYIEPFGAAIVEAMLCGTPVICTDWGGFTETVQHGVTGYRCRTFKEFCLATDEVRDLDPYVIRDYAVSNYSTEAVAERYEAYFERLLTLWGKGFYAE
jgi:glycosyltransferase involved in cell wall biosynthesis